MNDATQFFNTTAGGGYQIERSLRFNSADSAHLNRTPSVAGNRKTWTWAGWVKRGKLSVASTFPNIWSAGSSTNSVICRFMPDDTFNIRLYGSFQLRNTTQVFRDTSAWYHLVIAFDTTQATADDRVKFYVNGVQVSTFSTNNNVVQNFSADTNNNQTHYIGQVGTNSAAHMFDGYLADIHFIDGQALDPTSFGEFDTNGVWQPIDASGLTYGTNGFHLPFSDNSTAAALGTDTSGNGNDWTVNNFSAPVSNLTLRPRSTTTWTATGGMQNHPYFQASSNKTTSNFGYISSKNWNTSVSTTGGTMRIDFASPIAIAGDVVDVFQYNASYESPTLILDNAASLSPSSTTLASNPLYKYSTFVIPAGRTCASVFTTTTSGARSNFFGVMVNDVSVLTDDPNINNDSLVDSPTNYGTDTGAGGEVRGNYATFNGLITSTSVANARQVFSNGNLDLTSGASGNYGTGASTISLVSGKWYCEMLITVPSGADSFSRYGITAITRDFFSAGNNQIGGKAEDHVLVWNGGTTLRYTSNDTTQYTYSGASASSGSIFMLAYDADAGELWFGIDGTWLTNASGTGNPATGSNPDVSGLSGPKYFVGGVYNGGTSNQISVNFGQRPFAYTAPSGFKALNTASLPAPVVTKPSEYMDVALYTGNSTGSQSQTISGLGFSPDLLWIKSRSTVHDNFIFDAIRGPATYFRSNSTDGDAGADTSYLNSFNSDGFTVGYRDNTNEISHTFVAWTWDAGSSTVSNPDGSITSQVRANASAGFSVVSYTGNGSTGTVGHGLGVAPSMVLIKNRSASQDWVMWFTGLTVNQYFYFNTTDGIRNFTGSWGALPTSSVFSTFTTQNNTNNYVAYCFAPVAGYSSAFSYSGNGSSDGPYTYLGFRSRFIIIKRTDTTGDWLIYDTARDSYNTMTKRLYPNLSNAEADASDQALDVTANGFKVRANNGNFNASGGTYIGFAFAESPFQYARAR